MAESTNGGQLEKRVSSQESDPIVDRSLSGVLLVSSLLLIVSLVWSLFDEVFGQRPWRAYQKEFVELYRARLEEVKPESKENEEAVKSSSEYRKIEQQWKQADEAIKPQVRELDAKNELIDIQLGDITLPFQDLRAKIASINYQLEITSAESSKESLRVDKEKERKRAVKVSIHDSVDSIEEKQMRFDDLEALYNDLRDQKAKLVGERLKVTGRVTALKTQLDKYLQDNLVGLTEQQIDGLIAKTKDFKFEIKQIDLGLSGVVDRCASCHLGVTEPIELAAENMNDEVVFASHPNKDLLKLHDPERFGCSTCHGGNGRATTSVEKAHGRYKHWLWPLYYRENTQAGCNQCHDKDRVTPGADVLNSGKDLFQNRGCTGCHKYEGFDREGDALSTSRQSIKQFEMERDSYFREIKKVNNDLKNPDLDDVQVRALNRRILSLRQTISQVDGRIDQLDTQSRYLLQDQKKVGPNLKEVKLKLNRDWIPLWLRDPQAFRPGTKMPNFRLDDSEIKAISAFLWQSALAGPALAKQPLGDAANGKELFKSRGCLACHSIEGKLIGVSSGRTGGTFAADLSRLGEKANYDYIVRWVHNPRERTTPYCPTEKRDLTPEDYAKKKLPFVFDSDHSKCPSCGRELQIQNMTVMPNFRLSDQDARDIATFLVSLKRLETPYPSASFIDDASLSEQGAKLVQSYGCAGCHEIRGFEEEQRIGTELTKEGSKPIERLDFAVLTHDAMKGMDPISGGEEERPWYNHKGFFEHKLKDPAVFDLGKEKPREERLKMPNIFLEKDDITALTTFLLGSVESSLPASIRYNPDGQQKSVQEGWWVIKKYNCMGCHNVLIGQDSALMGLQMYQDADGREQQPPRLTTEGARVNPDWLLRFLKDPSLSGSTETTTAVAGETGGLKPQPGANKNGVRPYLKARMPTFNFSPNELQALVNFFMGASSQPLPYIPERLDTLAPEEQGLARALFTSTAAPCMKCHITGDPAHDARATAPDFLLARERLKPRWTERWLKDPALISPGTSMPSGLFKRDDVIDRWVFAGPTPAAFQTYEQDHAALLVRYMFQITPDEQRRLSAGASSGGTAQAVPDQTKSAKAGGSSQQQKQTARLQTARRR